MNSPDPSQPMTATVAVESCSACGGPLSAKRIIMDGRTYHEGCVRRSSPESETLLPCPFCGGEAGYYASGEAVFKANWIGHVCHCKNCQARVSTVIGKEAAAAMWNARALTSLTFPHAQCQQESNDDLEAKKVRIARAIYDVSIRWIAGNFPEDHQFLDFSQVSERDCNLHFDYAEAVLAALSDSSPTREPK